MSWSAFWTFLVALLTHTAVISFFVLLVIEPLFVSGWVAAVLTLLLIFAVGAVRGARAGRKHLIAFWLGLLLAVGLFLGVLTLMDWAVGMQPGEAATMGDLGRYLGRLRPTLPVLTFYLLPLLFALGASAAGHALGSKLRGRRQVQVTEGQA